MAKCYTKNNIRWSDEHINVLGVCVSHENQMERNYEPLLEKSKSVLNTWTNRGLSLFGKITVINTLVASLFVYKMTVLPQIPKKIIKSFESIITTYLWKGGRAKIALKLLQSNKNIGGANLVDLEKRDTALKVTWLQTLRLESDYSRSVYKQIHPLGENIWRVYINEKDVSQLEIKNKFWTDVLKSWARFNYFYNFKIENQWLWLNSRIKIENKIVWWKRYYNKGLTYVYQLFENRGVKSAIKLYQQYGVNFVEYNSLIQAIPKEWRDYFCNLNVQQILPVIPNNYDNVVNKPGISSFIYKNINNTDDKIMDKRSAWLVELQTAISIETFWGYFKSIYVTTNVNKYRSFQYRLMARGLVTNIKLHMWKIVDSPMCTFCKKELETVTHLLFECVNTGNILEYVCRYVNERFNKNISTNSTDIMFNTVCKRKACVCNFLILVAKQYVYKKRCTKELPNVTELTNLWYHLEGMEKYVAICNNQYVKHLAKWQGCGGTSNRLENVM